VVIGDLDEVQYDLEIDGEQVRKQLARKVWEKGAWATIAIVFSERDRGGDWKAPKLALLRFRKVRETWKREAGINFAGDDGLDLASAIDGWRALLRPEA